MELQYGRRNMGMAFLLRSRLCFLSSTLSRNRHDWSLCYCVGIV